jgi:DNA-binding Lrp family transcriptional regulator
MLTQKELKVLRCLRKDARKSMTSISRETGISLSAVMLIIKRLESGFIDKYTSLLNHSSLGHNIKVHFFMKKGDINFFKEHPQVNTIYKLSGDYSLFVEGIFRNMGEVEKFKENLSSYKLFFVVDETKVEGFLP